MRFHENYFPAELFKSNAIRDCIPLWQFHSREHSISSTVVFLYYYSWVKMAMSRSCHTKCFHQLI
jgi:hypothetical protein